MRHSSFYRPLTTSHEHTRETCCCGRNHFGKESQKRRLCLERRHEHVLREPRIDTSAVLLADTRWRYRGRDLCNSHSRSFEVQILNLMKRLVLAPKRASLLRSFYNCSKSQFHRVNRKGKWVVLQKRTRGQERHNNNSGEKKLSKSQNNILCECIGTSKTVSSVVSKAPEIKKDTTTWKGFNQTEVVCAKMSPYSVKGISSRSQLSIPPAHVLA